MPKYRVPVRVNVAPVYTFERTVVVEAESRAAAAKAVEQGIDDLVNRPGWRSISGRLGTMRPDRTVWDTYIDEQSLAEWVHVDAEKGGDR